MLKLPYFHPASGSQSSQYPSHLWWISPGYRGPKNCCQRRPPLLSFQFIQLGSLRRLEENSQPSSGNKMSFHYIGCFIGIPLSDVHNPNILGRIIFYHHQQGISRSHCSQLPRYLIWTEIMGRCGESHGDIGRLGFHHQVRLSSTFVFQFRAHRSLHLTKSLNPKSIYGAIKVEVQ